MLPSQEADVILDANARQFARYNGLTVEAIRRQLPEIRKRRYAIDDGHLVEGISAVAVPIVITSGEVAGSIAINMTSARLRKGRLHELVGILRREVEEIERTINPHDVSIAG
jgi:DNA-binding IclR family transcriptional regulator